MKNLKRTVEFTVILAVALTVVSSVALGQAGTIIDGAAIGRLISDAPQGCLTRFLALSLWVANDDPGDVDDTIYHISAVDGHVLGSIPAPGHHPQGLVAGMLGGDPLGLTLYVTDDDPDNVVDTIYEISAGDGTIITSFPASGMTGSLSPRALVESSTTFDILAPAPPCSLLGGFEFVREAWIANGNVICLIDLADGSNIRSIPSPCGSPQGLEIGINVLETTELWVACDDTDTIYLVDTMTGGVIRSIPAPASDSSGLALGLVGAEMTGEVAETFLLELWQGENDADTMEELTATGAFVRRIEPVCIDHHSTATESSTWGRLKAMYR